ncbi:MAG: hypothetical protein M3Z14_04605 [Candidatus Eremiobacteraeota bacterium]|nr:hypothetical protein [Candidatus Eremiobacteraeota bacterium]
MAYQPEPNERIEFEALVQLLEGEIEYEGPKVDIEGGRTWRNQLNAARLLQYGPHNALLYLSQEDQPQEAVVSPLIPLEYGSAAGVAADIKDWLKSGALKPPS